jgi:hypothetical protein
MLRGFARSSQNTSFSKAAINEASEDGTNPITLVDGYRLSTVILDERFHLSV